MNRRKILKGLSFLPLFGVASTRVQAEIKDSDDPAYKSYRGFVYFWTGWKNSADSAKITGQWLAYNKQENIRIYSCSGGYCGQYLIGHIFNTCTLADRKFMTIESSFDDREEEKWKARDALLEEIDRYYKEGSDYE